MSLGLDAFKPDELATVKSVLLGLIKSLEHKRALGSSSGLLTDESLVLEGLKHPERGDVEIIVTRESRFIEIFVSNRRDAENPFSVMNMAQLRVRADRRPVDQSMHIKENEYGLFLVSTHDREMLKEKESELVKSFSTHFGISAEPLQDKKVTSVAANKKLADCSPEEKWEIFKTNSSTDSRVNLLKQEFFNIEVQFHKYKKPTEITIVTLLPESYQSKLGQLVRDAYPYGIRTSLRQDYPKEHKEHINKVHKAIQALLSQLQKKQTEALPNEVKQFLKGIETFLSEVLTKDPELSRFV